MRLLGEELRRHKQDLGTLVSLENGKILAEGLGEVQEMIDMADFALGQSRMLYGLTMHSERPQHRMYEQWHPLGVVGIITRVQFPGRGVVVERLPRRDLRQRLRVEALARRPRCTRLPCSMLCNRVHGARSSCRRSFSCSSMPAPSSATRLVDDRRVALVSFTGSTAVGRRVAQSAWPARLGAACSNSAATTRSSSMRPRIWTWRCRAIVFGARRHRRPALHHHAAGASRTERIAAELERRLVHAYQQVRIGDPLERGTLMGPLIDPRAVRALRARRSPRAPGRRRRAAQRRQALLKRPGNFVEPAIVLRAQRLADRADGDLRTDPVPDCGRLTRRGDRRAERLRPRAVLGAVHRAAAERRDLPLEPRGSDCGIANINLGTSGAEIGGAFGGEKDTGGGRESGSDAWKAYMRRQTNTVNWSRALPLAQGIEFNIAPLELAPGEPQLDARTAQRRGGRS